MGWKDLRGFVSFLEERGELKRIKKEVDPKLEISVYSRKSCEVGGPAFLFENVKGDAGWRKTTGLFATRKRLIESIEGIECRDELEMLSKYRRAVATPIPPRIISKGACKEVVLEGDDADLAKIPFARHSERDTGFYVTSSVKVAKHPSAGVYLLEFVSSPAFR